MRSGLASGIRNLKILIHDEGLLFIPFKLFAFAPTVEGSWEEAGRWCGAVGSWHGYWRITTFLPFMLTFSKDVEGFDLHAWLHRLLLLFSSSFAL